MPTAAPARLLDLTRLVSRLEKGPLTGVDRVEAAWLGHLLAEPLPCFGLVRTRLGYLLLDRSGMEGLRDRLQGIAPLGPPDLLGRVLRSRQPTRACAEADMRRLSVARCASPFLTRMLRRHLPPGSSYLNVGHADLTESSLRQIKVAGLRLSVLVHDVIPLEHPEFTRLGVPRIFARKLAAISAQADSVIYATQDVRLRAEAQFSRLGRVPPGVIAPLGVTQARPDPEISLPGVRYFVAIGTIEPRKNHQLLLDVWDRLSCMLPAEDVPHLFILGRRGWSNAKVFRRLDTIPPVGRTIHEHSGLSDGAVAALLSGAEALLFPSFAEGYGLPPLEAMALGIPVICSNLNVFAETLTDYPVYLDPHDSYSWTQTIATWRETRIDANVTRRAVPAWGDHFRAVCAGS